MSALGRCPDDCDWTRRQFVRGLGLGMLGLTLPEVLHRQAVAAHLPRGGKATRCIMIFLFGGPSQIDTWDMKPEAPREYRGEFRPIATSVPGIFCCEHLPRTAKLAHHLAVVRSLTPDGPPGRRWHPRRPDLRRLRPRGRLPGSPSRLSRRPRRHRLSRPGHR